MLPKKLPPKKLKTIRVGDYLKKVQFANRFLPNKYDAMMLSDGYALFKEWGKGKVLWEATNVTSVTGGTLQREMKMGARMISIEFDDAKTPYLLKSDIIQALSRYYKDGKWSKGSFAGKKKIQPKDVEQLRLPVNSRWFMK